ncbi:MAG: hypothetical protein IME92_05100 [Proteobacteria bacterium]|nr:hypothetical protein [Pseudomonadota bacterium]
MKLARAIHFDESDRNIFHIAARTGEWAISGGFEFSDWSEADLKGKNRQAFSNGWLGMETFGRVTFVAVTQIEPAELEVLTDRLAQHFVDIYGAPSLDAARPVAARELEHAQDLCEDHDPNTLIAVSRELTEAGVNEQFRTIKTDDAGLDQFAIHADME